MLLRWVEVAALLALAWLAAVPLTRWFATRRWTVREPIAALLTWQAIGLTGGLAVLTAELTLAATGRHGPWRDAVGGVLAHPDTVDAVGTVGLLLLAASAGWLLTVLVLSFVRARRARATHRVLLELLATPHDEHGTTVDEIEADTPVAYALPRSSPRAGAHVVVSSATRRCLDDAALAAVVAHERAHLRQRHSVLVQPFAAWELSLPFLATPALARRRVEQLVEMACDDVACRVAGADAVGRALRAVAPDEPARAERLDRLPVRRAGALRAALVLAAVLLVATPVLLLVLAG